MIILLAGSNSPHSINQLLVEWVARLLEAKSPMIIQTANFELPLYSTAQEKKGFPSGLPAFIDQLAIADTLVIAVPEHNGSLPAFFKNVLDWVSRFPSGRSVFEGKKVHLLSASPGRGGSGAIQHTSDILQKLGAAIIQKLPLPHFYERQQKGESPFFPDAATEKILYSFIQKI
jgi:NAD(P)H-dependent FMN reductase